MGGVELIIHIEKLINLPTHHHPRENCGPLHRVQSCDLRWAWLINSFGSALPLPLPWLSLQRQSHG